MFSWLKRDVSVEEPKSLGQLGEEWAVQEYIARGYKVLAKNEYNRKGKRLGEIDFIVRNANTVVFVEVKTRTSGSDMFGVPAESVHIYKQLKMLKAIKIYLQQHSELQVLRPQIDVCLLEVKDIDKPIYSVTILENSVEDWN